jgi:hypothetical protein
LDISPTANAMIFLAGCCPTYRASKKGGG